MRRQGGQWVLVVAVVGVVVLFFLLGTWTVRAPEWGVTFSKQHAQSLGLDWRATYLAVLDDLGARRLRLPIAWDDVEAEEGRFYFDDYAWMLEEAGKRHARVTLAVGRKIPRWPECALPLWYPSGEDEQKQAILAMLRASVSNLRESSAVVSWQVENEPFLPFGLCKPFDLLFYRDEVALVRSLDARPIAGTSSGELEPYLHLAPFVDEVGFSLYRIIYNPIHGYLIYTLPPKFFEMRRWVIEAFYKEAYVSELQMEPWFTRPIEEMSIEEQTRRFTPQMFLDNLRYVRRVSASRVDLWGVEWWAYMRERGEDRYWNMARKVFSGVE